MGNIPIFQNIDDTIINIFAVETKCVFYSDRLCFVCKTYSIIFTFLLYLLQCYWDSKGTLWHRNWMEV